MVTVVLVTMKEIIKDRCHHFRDHICLVWMNPKLFLVVLTKVKLTFIDTIIRLEHLPKEAKTGAAIELRIHR